MRILRLPLIAPLLVALAGCTVGSTGRDASFPDAAPPDDAGISDAAAQCGVALPCPAGLRCFGGTCQPDPCAEANPCDPEGERCVAACVSVVDDCDGVSCDAGETCIGGDCFAGCLPSPCLGRVCPEGRYCDASTGDCVEIQGCSAGCGDDAACHVTCAPRVPCDGVSCGEGELCRDGLCAPNPCFEISCAAGEICENGECVGTCGCEPACVEPERCVVNRCACAPRCSAGASCGADDGCGGFCDGTCPGAREVCDVTTGLCECDAYCRVDAACGADNGCGGRCDGPCPGLESCADGACVCTDLCPPEASVECGVAIPDTCAGSLCPGLGALCPTGEECADGRCCGACPVVTAVPCGDPIPDPVDASGAPCRMCDGLGVMCGGGESCVVGPSGARVCCGLCADPSGVPCGETVPDVLDSSGAVCRGCSTRYGTMCAAGQTCTGGSAGVCCDSCASSADIPCATPIPDSPCHVCEGWGARCDPGSSCVNAPGTAGYDERECCDFCPPVGSIPCGTSVPPVLAADGRICRTCSDGAMCPPGERCTAGVCCTTTCTSASARACGSVTSDGCGGTCRPGTACPGASEICTGDPLACVCVPACGGRACGDPDGCGGECPGTCGAGLVCAEPAPGDYACEPGSCPMTCGLCESCVLGRCEPLSCAAGQSPCLSTCSCCTTAQVCMPTGCVDFG